MTLAEVIEKMKVELDGKVKGRARVDKKGLGKQESGVTEKPRT